MHRLKVVTCCAITYFFALGLVEHGLSSENWTIIGSRTDGTSYQYDKNSIKKISNDVYEVYDASTSPKGPSVRQIRIDCAKKKLAIGEAKGWAYGNLVADMNFSKNGWVWFDASGWEVDLMKIVCLSK